MPFKYKSFQPILGDREVDPDGMRGRLVELLDFYTENLGLYRKDLAEQLHLSETDLSLFCTGSRFVEGKLLKVCYMLGISVDYVLFGENTGSVIEFKRNVLEKRVANAKEDLQRLEEGPQ